MEAKTRAVFERLDSGERDAFTELVSIWERRVLAIITGFFSAPSDVEDISQEVFLRIFKSLDRYDREAPFAPWLAKITVNLCRDELRRRRRQKVNPFASFSAPEVDLFKETITARGNSDAIADSKPLMARTLVEKLLALLPEKARLILTLREYQGWSEAEIAGFLGCSVNSVSVQIHRARKRLRTIMRKETKKIVSTGRGTR